VVLLFFIVAVNVLVAWYALRSTFRGPTALEVKALAAQLLRDQARLRARENEENDLLLQHMLADDERTQEGHVEDSVEIEKPARKRRRPNRRRKAQKLRLAKNAKTWHQLLLEHEDDDGR